MVALSAVLIASLAPVGQPVPLVYAGSLTEQLRTPARITVAADDSVLVSDAFHDHVARFDASGNLLGTWPVSAGPVGLAVHPDGRYFVSLRDEPKVAIYDNGFNFSGYLGEGEPPVTFVRPTDIEIAADTGRIFVVDCEGHRLHAFNANGNLALTIGIRGHLAGRFIFPSSIALDIPRNRIVIADHDNFRIQMFSRGGVLHRRFGDRMRTSDGGQVGWMPRTQGVAVDSAGNVYVADGLMNTVLVYSEAGVELGSVAGYGSGPGDVRIPCDLAFSSDGSRLYVVSTNTSSIEIYASSALLSRQDSQSFSALGAAERSPNGLWQAVRGPAKQLDNTLRRVGEVDAADLVSLLTPTPDVSWLGRPLLMTEPGWEGPHVIDAPVICQRCHGNTGQPGSHPGTAEGQGVLCMSCHNASGQSMAMPIHEKDLADPYGTNPNAADGRGRSHAWGVPAVNASADSVGPPAENMMARYLDTSGNIKCSTCHNQHNNDAGQPYLRVSNEGDAMCKACHAPRNEGLAQRGTHPVGFDYPGGVGEFPSDGAVAPLLIKGGNVECMTCHAPHYASSGAANSGEGDGMLLRGANDETFCQTCHTQHAIHDVRGAWKPTCTTCHDVHDPTSENVSLVAQQVNSTPMVFQDDDLGANSVSDFIRSNHASASYDGICEVCHTSTAHHGNSAGGDHDHNKFFLCTDCHPHSAGFKPTGGSCTDCHSNPQDNGDNIPPGGRRAVVPDDTNANDFGNTSHHIRGDVEPGDCQVCHDQSEHQQGHVRLKDPDDAGIVYIHDQATADELETFCLNCHDGDGASDGPGTQPFSDGVTVPNIKGAAGSRWVDSAHKVGGRRCNDCHTANAHGSANIKLLLESSVDALCFNCHTEGVLTNNAISGPELSDDIEEAFSFGSANKHDIGSSFTIGPDTFSLQCTSCHNPHVVTGKYWDAASSVTPITRPDFSDPVHNPRVMGTNPWGDGSGEKMDDYAGGGTYRAPTGDSFSGSQLPDYNTFCDDCHEPMPDPNAEAGAHGQLHFSGDPHGLSSANVPDGGATCPNWYTCGKGVKWDGDNCTADDGGGSDAECWPVIPRGRGEQIWSKSPYLQEERIAGSNFVLSCTDCHEAHGSSVQSMIRTNPNSGTGSTNWLTMCLNCHYYYSEFHAGMNCGNASCHGANAENARMTETGTDTLHRMGQRYGDSSTRTFNADLVLDLRFENNLEDSSSYRLDGVWSLNRPDSNAHSWCSGDPAGSGTFVDGRVGKAIQIDNQPVEAGTEDCDWSNLENKYTDLREDNGLSHIHPGHGTWKYTEMKYNMSLEAWVYPTDDANERKILAKYAYANGGYALVLRQFDSSLRAGVMANVNGGSGSGDCGGLRGAYSSTTIPLSSWTHVAATYDASGPDRDVNDGSVGRIRVYVNGEDVTASSSDESSCYAQPGAGEDAMFPNSQHDETDPGGWHASPLSVGGNNWSDATSNFIGQLDNVMVWNITKGSAYFDSAILPSITSAVGVEGSTELIVELSEGVYSNAGEAGNLDSGDFVLTCGGKTIAGVTHTAGSNSAVVTLNAGLGPGDIGTCTLAPNGSSIYDEYGSATPGESMILTERPNPPSILSAQAPAGSTRVCLRFSERVYTDQAASGALTPADFSVSNHTVNSVSHTAGKLPTALVLNTAPVLGTDTVRANGDEIFDLTDIPAGTEPVTIQAAATEVIPTIALVEGVSGSDILKVTFDAQVYSHVDGLGALQLDDFAFTGTNSITGISHDAGSPVAFLTMNRLLEPNDFDNVTQALGAALDAIFGPVPCSFPVGTGSVTITEQTTPPSISRVEGAVNFDQLFVSFTEAVYTGTGQSGALVAGDFAFTDGNTGGAASVIDVTHTAGDSTALITVNTPLVASDIGADTLAALGDQVFNSIHNPMATTAVTITGNDCPVWGTTFPIEDEPQYSATISDDTTLLTGTVGNPTFVFPNADNDWFTGAESQGTYLDVSNTACYNSPRALTIEARVKPTELDRGVADNTFNRIFERRRTILVTILNTDYRGDDVPERMGKASIEVKYRADAASRHTCPHPQWPSDTVVQNDVRMHQVSSDIYQWPLVNNHWYQIRVVFNADKPDFVGSDGTPVDIFIDDQGALGDNAANPTPGDPGLNPDYEQWPDYINATTTINNSSSCRWGSLPGDVIEFRNDSTHIGTNWNHTAQQFEGLIDWVTWQPVANYVGVDDPPH